MKSLDPGVCPCSTMFRIDLPHLAYILDELAAGRVHDPIFDDDAHWSRTALQRMLDITGT